MKESGLRGRAMKGSPVAGSFVPETTSVQTPTTLQSRKTRAGKLSFSLDCSWATGRSLSRGRIDQSPVLPKSAPESGVVRSIRTCCSVPLLYVPRTTGTLVPDGRERETHAPTVIAAPTTTCRTRVTRILVNDLLHCLGEARQGRGDFIVAVRGGHETRLECGRRQ